MMSNQLSDSSNCDGSKFFKPQLKPAVHWVEHPEGYWILRNSTDITYFHVFNPKLKIAIDCLGQMALSDIAQQAGISRQQLLQLLEGLKRTKMLDGIDSPETKRRKFNPLQVLSFRVPLLNPDVWLTKHIEKINWLWSRAFGLFLLVFLVFTAVAAFASLDALRVSGVVLLSNWGIGNVTILSVVFLVFVVSIHELGHAFTLKHFGGIVPCIGLTLGLMPGCYTDTSDAYCLKRSQQILVFAAGILCQLIMGAIGFWIWSTAQSETWLSSLSYLFMVTSLLTVIINLNPLTRLDGYYLAVAFTGILSLRSYSFQFYRSLLNGKLLPESDHKRLILALYAPFSLFYTFGLLFSIAKLFGDWILTNIPNTFIVLFGLWILYWLLPESAFALKPRFEQLRYKKEQASSKTEASKASMLSSTKSESGKASVDPSESELVKSEKKRNNRKKFVPRWKVFIAIALLIIPFLQNPFNRIVAEAEVKSVPGERQTVSMPSEGGTVKEIFVSPDKIVQEGTELAVIFNPDLDQEVDNAKTALENARASEKEALSAIEDLRFEMLGIDTEISRYDYLVKAGAYPRLVLEKLQIKRTGLQARIQSRIEQLSAYRYAIANRETEIERLNSRQINLTIKARIRGTVIGKDLDRLKGNYLKGGELIMEIADMTKVSVSARIRPSDADLVEKNSEAVFYPERPTNKEYSSKVAKIPSTLSVDENHQQRYLELLLEVDNQVDNDPLKLGEKGNVKVKTRRLRIYEWAMREIQNVIPFRRFT